MVNLRPFLTVILLLTFTGCKQQPTSETVSPKAKMSQWKPDGVHFASFALNDDFEGFLDGKKSVFTQDDLRGFTGVDLVTNAEVYQRDFDSNEIAATQKYQHKKLLVISRVSSINIDALGNGYLTLVSKSLLGVQAHLAAESLTKAADTNKGDLVGIVCDPSTRIIGVPNLTNCLYLSQYMKQAHTTPEEQVESFFDKGTPLPARIAAAVIASYLAATSSILPKTCIANPDKSSCDPSKWNLPKSSDKSITDVESKAVASIKPHIRKVACDAPTKALPANTTGTKNVCVALN